VRLFPHPLFYTTLQRLFNRPGILNPLLLTLSNSNWGYSHVGNDQNQMDDDQTGWRILFPQNYQGEP
jgi:hypothetical protein